MTTLRWEEQQAIVAPIPTVTTTQGEGDRRINGRLVVGVRDINLPFITELMDFVRSNELVGMAHHLLTRNTLQEGAFTILLGEEPGVEVDYMNTPAFKEALMTFLAEAGVYLMVLGFVVVRFVRDRVRHVVDELMLQGGSGAPHFHLPFVVERLDDEQGELAYITYSDGHGDYYYEPRDADLLDRFDFQVLRAPARSFTDPIPYEQFIARLDGNVRTYLEGRLATHRAKTQRMRSTRSQAGYVLDSAFWTLFVDALYLREARVNHWDADAITCRPRPVLTRRAQRDMAPDLLGANVLQQTASIAEAQSLTADQIAEMNWAHGVMWASRGLTEHMWLPTGGDEANPSKRRRMMTLFDRPDTMDDPVLLPETFGGLDRAVAASHLDLTQLRVDFASRVAQTMGGIPVANLLAMYTGGSSNVAVTGPRRPASTDGTVLGEQMETVLHQQRDMYGYIFTWAHRLALADLNLARLHELVENYTNLQRQQVQTTLAARRGVLSKKERRRLLLRAMVGQKRRRVDDETTAPTLAELREQITARLGGVEQLDATLVFDADVQRELERDKLRDHEYLDPVTHQSRIKEMELLASLCKDGILAPESLQRAAKDLLNLQIEVMAPPPPPAPKVYLINPKKYAHSLVCSLGVPA